jgi:hypothetical protein
MQAINIYTLTEDQRATLSNNIKNIQTLIGMLEPYERVVLDLHINHNVTVYQMSVLSGRSQQAIGSLIRRLLSQLAKGHYLMLYRQRHWRHASPKALKVGYDRYLLGMGYRTIAAKRQMSTKEVRQILKRQDRWLSRYLNSAKKAAAGGGVRVRRHRPARKKPACVESPGEEMCQNKE